MTLEAKEHWADGYYSARRALYHVEQHLGEHVLVEDCSTGELLVLLASDLARMTPVQPARRPEPLAQH